MTQASAASSPFTHIVLTRFNVRVAASWSDKAVDPEWLTHRFKVFDELCAPSLRAQGDTAFTWLVFFDSETPAPFLEKIEQLKATTSGFTPVFIPRFEPEAVDSAVESALGPGVTHLITTRLDNDDALRTDHLARVQACFESQPREFINFDRGYILHQSSAGARLYEHTHTSNAFASLIEEIQTVESETPRFRTVWGWEHTKIADGGTVRHIDHPPAWLQVVHDRNVSNRVRGRRRPVASLDEGFPFARGSNTGAGDSSASILFDRILCEPVRAMRELAIAGAKTVLRRG